MGRLFIPVSEVNVTTQSGVDAGSLKAVNTVRLDLHTANARLAQSVIADPSYLSGSSGLERQRPCYRVTVIKSESFERFYDAGVILSASNDKRKNPITFQMITHP